MQSKIGQITVFIIIAVLIVGAAITIFIFRDSLGLPTGKSEFAEVYEFFEQCVEQKTLTGLSIAGTQGGYIEPPEFEPGSEYAPFSSQLDFLGSPVPYWYYVSANGIVREQAPSLNKIENELGNYLEEEIATCDFSNMREKGYVIDSEMKNVDVAIRENRVDVSVSMNLDVAKGESKAVKRAHDVKVNSKFGEFYSIAKQIYNKEKQDMFLENYALDVMYNYAPVTNTELSCTPLIWKGPEVAEDIRSGLSANIGALKADDKSKDYFSIGIDSDENVNFIYDANWPTRIEIWPADNQLLVAEPVGLESGMGILGFCYVPYHFVYDIYFPTLIQVYDGKELFQFPVAVVVDKSVARQALPGTTVSGDSLDELCNYKNTQMTVYTYNNDLEPVEADVDFVCMNTKCNMGKTEVKGGDAVLSEKFPQCVNGKVIARAEGYLTTDYMISTNSPGTANVLMEKLYELDLDLVVGGHKLDRGLAVINFEGQDNSVTVAYPEQKTISLSEDYYKISVQVFGDSSLTIPSSSSRQCIETPASGLLGFFGKTTEECFDVNLPSQTIDQALIAGGNLEEYILETDLKNSNRIQISVPSLPRPSNLDQLQQNYELIETNKLGVVIG